MLRLVTYQGTRYLVAHLGSFVAFEFKAYDSTLPGTISTQFNFAWYDFMGVSNQTFLGRRFMVQDVIYQVWNHSRSSARAKEYGDK